MRAAVRLTRRTTGPIVFLPLALAAVACTGEDVGDADKAGSGATSGVGAPAAGGAGGVDTAGTRVNPGTAGSAVAPGPGQIPGAPGTATRDTAAAKTKASRP
jgi:hypothetical protein